MILINCAFLFTGTAQSADTGVQIRAAMANEIVQWLKPGTYIPKARGEVNTRMRFAELLNKIEKAQREDPKWFTDSAENLAANDSARFFAKIGLTNAQYNEYRLLSDLPLHYSKHDTLRIYRRGNSIFFIGSGKFAALNPLRFYIARNTFQYHGYTLHYTQKKLGHDEFDTADTPLRSWYVYNYIERNDSTEVTSENLESMFTIKHFWIHVGKEVDSKKSVLNFSDFQMEGVSLKAFIQLDLIFEGRLK